MGGSPGMCQFYSILAALSSFSVDLIFHVSGNHSTHINTSSDSLHRRSKTAYAEVVFSLFFPLTGKCYFISFVKIRLSHKNL